MTEPSEPPCKAKEKKTKEKANSITLACEVEAYRYLDRPTGQRHTYESLVDLARVRPPFLAVAIDGATAVDSELVDAPEHDPVPPVIVGPIRPVWRCNQGALHRERDTGLARATEGEELQQVAPAGRDEHDGRPWRGARRLPRHFQRPRVIVPPVATGTVAVEAEHALRCRRRSSPGRGRRSAGDRPVQVAVRAVSRAARSCSLKDAGHEEQREERRHVHKLHPAGCHWQS
jgi:hypothetical protein